MTSQLGMTGETGSETPRELTIGELAAEADLPHSTLRYYDRLGLVVPSHRVRGERRYAPDAIAAVRAVRLAQRAGLSLTEIRRLLDEFPRTGTPSAEARSIGRRRIAELDAAVREALSMRELIVAALTCSCTTLSECDLLASRP